MGYYLFEAIGFRSTRMTESPLKNILLMYRSLLTGLAFFLPEMITYMINKSTNEELQLYRQKLVIYAQRWLKIEETTYPFPFWEARSTFLWRFQEPCCNVCRKLWLGPKAFCYFCSWWELGCCFWRIEWELTEVRCWILPLLAFRVPRESFLTLVCSLEPTPWLKSYQISNVFQIFRIRPFLELRLVFQVSMMDRAMTKLVQNNWRFWFQLRLIIETFEHYHLKRSSENWNDDNDGKVWMPFDCIYSNSSGN